MKSDSRSNADLHTIYRLVKEDIIHKITAGDLAPGDKLPSERQLSILYSASRATIRQAINELVSEDLLEKIPSKGTYVRDSRSPETKNGNIAFIRYTHGDRDCPISDDIFYPKVLKGIEQVATIRNYHCFVKWIKENESEKRSIDQLTPKVDGFICGELHSETFLNHLVNTRLPVVLINPSVDTAITDIVESDDVGGAVQAVNHLIELGHRRIGFIGGSPGNHTSQRRKRGYTQALIESGIPVNEALSISYGWRLEDGYKAMTALLKREPRPTGIFAASDLLALGAYQAIQTAGFKIPNDISIIGFDDIDMASQAKPSLSTVMVRKGEMGEVAADLLFERFKRSRGYPLKVLVPITLQLRESTTAAPI